MQDDEQLTAAKQMPFTMRLLLPVLTAVLAIGAAVQLVDRSYVFAAILLVAAVWGLWLCVRFESRLRRLRRER